MTALVNVPSICTTLESRLIFDASILASVYREMTAIEGDGGAVRSATMTYFPVYSTNKTRVVARVSLEIDNATLFNGKRLWENIIPLGTQPVPSYFS